MGETRVDLMHLLEDLRDAYSGSVEETILTELIANAMDAGADSINVKIDPEAGALIVGDNGTGMHRRELERFHDIASTTKARGSGIGFAGVGVKLGLLVASNVFTETQANGRPVATSWRLASRRRAPWDWAQPEGLVTGRGTAVRLQVPDRLSLLLDDGFVERALVTHFAALLNPMFDQVLARHYPNGVVLSLNGRRLTRRRVPSRGTWADLLIKLPRQHHPAGVGYLRQASEALPEDERGVAVSALGKIVQRGWDWLGLSPASPETISGLIEVPELAGCLQTNKAGFILQGALGAKYLRYREAIQHEVSRQLERWGVDQRTRPQEPRRAVRAHELDLERVLGGLAEDFPLLTAISEKHRGGQYRLLEASNKGNTDQAVGAAAPINADFKGATIEESVVEPEQHAPVADPPSKVEEPESKRRRRRGHLQVRIRFESLPKSLELARLADSVVWVNQAHPAYKRAQAGRSTGYHLAVACCLALANLAAVGNERAFICAFLARWGDS